MKHLWNISVSRTHGLPQNCATRKNRNFCIWTYTLFKFKLRSQRRKTGKKGKKNYMNSAVGVPAWYLGHQKQWITSCKGLFSSTSRGCNVDTKCRCFPRLTLHPTGSTQRGCSFSKFLPRLAELVPVAAEGLLRLVMSRCPFCLGLLQLLFSAWLSVFSLFFHKKCQNWDKHLWPQEELYPRTWAFFNSAFQGYSCLQFLAMLTSKMHWLVKIVISTAKMDKVSKSCRITLGQKAKNKSKSCFCFPREQNRKWETS